MKTAILYSILILLPCIVFGQYVKQGGKFLRTGTGKPIKISPYTAPEEEDNENFVIIDNWDFETLTLGEKTNDSMDTYFGEMTIDGTGGGGAKTIVADEINEVSTKVFRFTHNTGESYNGWGGRIHLNNSLEEATWDYYWKFSSNFNSTLGGKIPGFCTIVGSDKDENDYQEDGDGWLANMLYKQGEFITSYHYDFSKSDNFVPWASDDNGNNMHDSIMLIPGNWYLISQRIRLNTFTGGSPNDDGIFEVMINGRIYIQEDTVIYRNSEDADSCLIDAIYFANYYGGDNNSSWWPDYVCYGYVDSLTVYNDTSDTKYGSNDLHSSAWTPYNIIPNDTFYYDSLINNASSNLTSPQYSSYTTAKTNYFWLIDAGDGYTVEVDFDAGEMTSDDYLIFYDGNTTDAEEIERIDYYTDDMGSELGGDGVVESTGRYMFVAYMVAVDEYSKFTGDVTFNSQ